MVSTMADYKNDDYNPEEISSLLNTIDSLVTFSGGGKKANETVTEARPVSQKNSTPGRADINELKRQGFAEAQIHEIEKGMNEMIPTEIYAQKCYNWMQMREIRKGLLKNLNTSMYEDPLYSASQMREIRLGLLDHLDVSSYAKLILSATDMLRIRKILFAEAYQKNPTGFGWTAQHSDYGIHLRVSQDCMKAFLTLPESFRYKELTEDHIMEVLEEYGIVYGILSSAVSRIVNEKPIDEEICIAQGKTPAIGKSGWYELFFDNCIEKGHTAPPDGDIDYTDVNVIDAVVPGQMLAKYHPAQKNIEGMTVTGIPLNGVMGEELPDLSGHGIEYDAGRNLYFATCKGYASYDATTSSLNVWNVYKIKGDISYFQNTEYDGAVHVLGSVKNSTIIRAKGDIIIDGFVENSTIISQQNIVIKGGVNGSGSGVIEAGGSCRGTFFEYATVKAGGLVEGNYFLRCKITTDDRLVAKGKKARIMGGNITAAIGVEAVIIGNYLSDKTICNVGDIHHLEKRIIDISKKKHSIANELQQLNDGKQKLINLIGEDHVDNNTLYQKTKLAIEIKEGQMADCNKEISHLKVVISRAGKAYIKAQREVQTDVTFIFNGKRQKIEQDIKHGLFLTKERIQKQRR